MATQHIIITSDTIFSQLIAGLMRKKNLVFTSMTELEKTNGSLADHIFIIDLTDNQETAYTLWENCNNYGIVKQCIFLINQAHPLHKTVIENCRTEQIIVKPVMPDKLYSSLDSLHSANKTVGKLATTPKEKMARDNTREIFMKRALDISFEKMREERCPPFGAVIVKDNKIIAEGWSEVLANNDPTAHAEIMALRKAGRKLEHHRLRNCEIYTSSEPCPMCLSALYLAGIQKIYYANSIVNAEEFGFDGQTLYDEIAMPQGKRIMPYIRLMEDEAIYAFEEWKNNFRSEGYNIKG